MSLPMLQVALDNQTMDSAYETTRLIAEEVDIIEVGTILCVGEGVRAVRDLKALYPHKIVLADAKIADAGKILSRMCFEANADWVTVICCADINTAKGALDVAKEFNGDVQIELTGYWTWEQAQQWRDWLAKRDGLDSSRLIAGESDGLPGVTIDRFGNFLVLQLLSAGAEYQRAALISALQTLFPQCAIYDRSDVAVRKKEGMELTQGPVTGELTPALLPIEEHGMKLLVDIQGGHKTGYYLDQRDSRLATRQYVADKRVLNCFSYTGGFAVSALMGGCAQVVSVDTSQEALDVAKQNVELNKLDLSKAEFIRDDVFKLLRKYRDQGEKFDVIVMDPPKFVENKSQLMGACRGYKDINMLAIQLLNPGGVLLTFSCSGLMTTDLFQKIIADAAIDAGRDVQFIEQFRQAADHPVIATYPEGLYLKGFACRIM